MVESVSQIPLRLNRVCVWDSRHRLEALRLDLLPANHFNVDMLKGLIFDLDGTLVDSRLDFAAIRRDLGLPAGEPILEAIARETDADKRRHMEAIVIKHERRGAEVATLMPGVREAWGQLADRSLPLAVFTRNAKSVALETLTRVRLEADVIVAREDAPPKPDPAGLFEICARWGCSADDVLYVGDYLYDLEAGRRAGITTVLFAPTQPDFPHDAAWVLPHFDGLLPLCDEIFRVRNAERATNAR